MLDKMVDVTTVGRWLKEDDGGAALLDPLLDSWVRRVGSALDSIKTTEGDMPGPKMQLEGAPRQTA